MHLVPAPAVRLMKRRVLSRPGLNSLMSFLSRPGSGSRHLFIGLSAVLLSLHPFFSSPTGQETRKKKGTEVLARGERKDDKDPSTRRERERFLSLFTVQRSRSHAG